jgi:hypothetical protein
LDDTAWGAASDVVPKFVSPSDPAAQWSGAHKGPAFFAYANREGRGLRVRLMTIEQSNYVPELATAIAALPPAQTTGAFIFTSGQPFRAILCNIVLSSNRNAYGGRVCVF